MGLNRTYRHERDVSQSDFGYGTSGRPLRAVSESLAGLSRACLIFVLIAAPWFFGGVKYEPQWWLYNGVFASLGLWLLSFLLERQELRVIEVVVPTLLVPLCGALLLGTLQITPGLPQKLPRIEYYNSAEPPSEVTSSQLGKM